MNERLLCSCDGFCGASEQEAGAHVTCRLVASNLELIRRFFSNLQGFASKRVEMARLFCSQPLILLQWLPTIAKLQKNATLTGQKEEGDVQLKVSFFVLLYFGFWTIFSSWEFRRLIPFCQCEYYYIDTHYFWAACDLTFAVCFTLNFVFYLFSTQNGFRDHFLYISAWGRYIQ